MSTLPQLRLRLFAELAPSDAPDLPLRRDRTRSNPLDDLSLVDAAMAGRRRLRLSDAGPDLDRIFGAPEPAARHPRDAARSCRSSARRFPTTSR